MGNTKQVRFSVESMSCASCVGRVDKALAAVPGVTEVNVNLAAESATVRYEAPATPSGLAETLREAGYPTRSQKVTLTIESMSCASCVGRIDKALAAVPGVIDVSVNLASETASVTYLEGATTPHALTSAAAEAGYPAKVVGADADAPQDNTARKDKEARVLRRDTLIAAALALPVFLLEMGGHLVPALNRPDFTGGQNSRRIARYGTESKEEDLEAVFTRVPRTCGQVGYGAPR